MQQDGSNTCNKMVTAEAMHDICSSCNAGMHQGSSTSSGSASQDDSRSSTSTAHCLCQESTMPEQELT
jgi:hypothetical protein